MRRDYPKVFCAACKHEGRQDTQWPQLCTSCAGKLRAIDIRASDNAGIKKDMIESGVPLGRERRRDE